MRNFKKTIFSLNFLYLTLIAAQVAAIIFLCFYIPSLLPAVLTFIMLWLVTAITAAVLFSREGAPEVKCAWFVCLAALPIAGALIYLLATFKRKPYGILKVNADRKLCGLSAAANELCGTCETGFERAIYFKGGAEFFNAIVREIESAKKCVYIEFFIISRGHVYSTVLQALESAIKRGAEVKIILDGIGSAFKIGKREIKNLKAMGAEVLIFHRLTPLPRARLNFRDHRKIVAVDGKVAFTGGFNLADEYANISSPYGYWKDSGLAVYGAAAKVFEGMFLSVWQKSYEMPLPEGGKYRCLPFYDSPPHRAFCEEAFAQAISSAKKRVHILTPYFCAGEKTLSALSFAARRGVEVKVILPHIPDKKYAFEISKAHARELRKCGVQFFEYTPGFMHAKVLICDDGTFLGSYNFDYRSTHYNYECGAFFTGDMCEEAERDFDECLTLSAPITEDKVAPHKRFTRFLLKLFAPLI